MEVTRYGVPARNADRLPQLPVDEKKTGPYIERYTRATGFQRAAQANDPHGLGWRRCWHPLKGEEGNGRQEQEGQGEGREAERCETAAGREEEEREAA